MKLSEVDVLTRDTANVELVEVVALEKATGVVRVLCTCEPQFKELILWALTCHFMENPNETF